MIRQGAARASFWASDVEPAPPAFTTAHPSMTLSWYPAATLGDEIIIVSVRGDHSLVPSMDYLGETPLRP